MPWLPKIVVRLLASRTRLWAALVAGAVGLSGCTAMDEFSWKKRNFEVFVTPSNPAEVVKHSTNGSERIRAIRAMHEPGTSSGSEQDLYVTLLTQVATSDGNPLCRMAAIGTLRNYRDPRATAALKEAYYRAGSFHSDPASVIRRQALDALGASGRPEAVELLVRVLREPPTEGPHQDRDAKLQERISAARALAKFDTPEARTALVAATGTNEDIALQRRAHESLVSITGVHMPQRKEAWEQYMRNPAAASALAERPHLGEQILQVAGSVTGLR